MRASNHTSHENSIEKRRAHRIIAARRKELANLTSDEDERASFDASAEITTDEPRRGFNFAEMVACEACLRANPPTRMDCLYCGAKLPATAVSEALRRPTLRKLEDWEHGFNTILLPRDNGEATRVPEIPESSLAEAAVLLRLEAWQLREIVEASSFLPVARAASSDEAALIETRLGALGFQVETISDEELGVENEMPRARRLEMTDDTLSAWTGAGIEELFVAWDEIILLVAGRIYTKRIEVEERRGRRAEGEFVESREAVGSEPSLVVCGRTRDECWRIEANGFDFSCLGARKKLLAVENFVVLTEMLRERATNARYDDSYWETRKLLAPVWALSEHTHSQGLRRARPGRFHTESVTTMTNEAQFARYARLLHHYELRRRALQS